MENSKKIDVVFMGTAAFGVPLLMALANDERFHVALVVTQEDRPAGRRLKPTPSPIKEAAIALGLPLFQPKDINATTSVETIRELPLPQIIVVVAYGQILKKPILDLPSVACVNVHGSLLPKHRGASPIQSAILGGEKETGISVMRMEEGLDSGPVYASFAIPIKTEDTSATLHDALAQLSAKKTPDALEAIVRGTLKSTPQNDAKATHCAKITKEAGEIDWNEPAETIALKMRAFAGWPGIYTRWNGRVLKIISAQVLTCSSASSVPGVVFESNKGPAVGTGNGLLRLNTLQLEGKKSQPIQEFLNGHPDFVGAILGR